jgi:hypothetical protein
MIPLDFDLDLQRDLLVWFEPGWNVASDPPRSGEGS